jgi:hypothetical protein
MIAWLGNKPLPPVFIPYDVKSTADVGLRIRATHYLNGIILGKLYPYSPAVTILEEWYDGTQYTWGRCIAGWLRLDYTRKV